MRDVLIALIPTTVAGALIFGWRSLLVVAVCVAACVLSEALFNVITKKTQTVGDLSAAVTGLLLGLNLPANIPLWQCVIGCIFAMVIVKGLFGGIGCNPVNPAITARVFMLIAFGSMTVQAFPKVDAVSSATPLSGGADDALPSLLDLFLGLKGGAIGEVCGLALLIGLVYLLVRRIITWHIPVTFVGSVYVLSFLMEGMDPVRALAMVLSGGLLIGAIFMATDYVTSPKLPLGQLIFGIGCGIITMSIRLFGSYPEGVSFSILLMNICTPLINNLSYKFYLKEGGAKNGK
jgi:electron transport complex protein RnfD